MKRLKTLLSLAFISLLTASCSGNTSVVGKYSFGMGKAGQTASFKAAMTLTDVAYKSDSKAVQEKNPKLMSLDLNLGAQESEAINALLKIFGDGYYYTNANSKKLSLCFPKLLNALEKWGVDLKELGITEEELTKIIEHLVYSYIDGNKIILSIPVFGEEDFTNPENDIIMNLCWYGLYISPTNPVEMVTTFDFATAPKAGKYSHEPGSKITEQAVFDMNEDFKSYFCNTAIEVKINGEWTTVAGVYKEDIGEGTMQYRVAMYPEYRGTMILANADAKVVNKNLLIYEDEKPGCFELVTAEGTSEYIISKVYEDHTKEKELSMEDFTIKDPFVYRKAHNVEIGLTKE